MIGKIIKFIALMLLITGCGIRPLYKNDNQTKAELVFVSTVLIVFVSIFLPNFLISLNFIFFLLIIVLIIE
jgi:hypothetical protein